MEPTPDLSTMLSALLFGAMLAAFTQRLAMRRKHRDDQRRYRQRVGRNHGGPRRGQQAPPDA